MHREKSCGAVVVREDAGQKEILLIRHNAGHWAFPKGHMEEGETEVQTASREIQEETGLMVDIDGSFRTVITYSPAKNAIKDVVYFIGRNPRGRLRPQPEEISCVRWVTAEEAQALITYENDRQVLGNALAHL